MTTLVITVAPTTSVKEVAKRMLEQRISAMPVVDARGHVQGIVSEGDLMRRVETGTEGHRSWWLATFAGGDELAIDYMKLHGRTAADVMTPTVVTVGERTSLEKVATLLERHRIKRVPVVRNGKIVGLVSRANLLHGLVASKTAGGPPATTDRAIRTRIRKELERTGMDKSYVNVVVARGVVEFWGFVHTDAEKRALGIAAKSVQGVKRVVDNVTVIPAMLRGAMGPQ